MIGWGKLEVHSTKNVFARLGIERLGEVTVESMLLECTALEGLDEHATVVAEDGELHEKAAGQSAFCEAYGFRWAHSLISSSQEVHRIHDTA